MQVNSLSMPMAALDCENPVYLTCSLRANLLGSTGELYLPTSCPQQLPLFIVVVCCYLHHFKITNKLLQLKHLTNIFWQYQNYII